MENKVLAAPLGRLAQFAAGLSWDTLPEAVQKAAVCRALDLISAAMGAVGNPLVEQMKQALQALDPQNRTQGVTLWGQPLEQKWPVTDGAMLNAMLAHTLELDDVHPASKTHISASMIPAAWCLGQQLGSTGKEFLTALVAGYEVAHRVGMAMDVAAHRKRGWHATSTCGTFGAAAACSHLLGLDGEGTASALGLAGSQTTGVWAFLGDGTNSKVLNPGQAAMTGIRCTFLARYGMRGPIHILEAEDGGLFRAMSDGGHVEKLTEGLGTCWEILNMDMKPYPCCRSAHAGIDGALSLRKAILGEGVLPFEDAAERILGQVESLEAGTYKIGYQQCAVSEGCLHPRTPLDAKFSLPYGLACSLLYGKVDQSMFTPEKVQDPAIRALMQRITVREDPELTAAYPGHWSCRVKIRLQDGRELEQFIQDPTGSYRKPLPQEALLNKAEGLLEHVYPGRGRQVAIKLLHLGEMERLPEI